MILRAEEYISSDSIMQQDDSSLKMVRWFWVSEMTGAGMVLLLTEHASQDRS